MKRRSVGSGEAKNGEAWNFIIENTCNDDRKRVLKIIKTTNYEYD